MSVANYVGGERANQLLSSAFAAFDSGVVVAPRSAPCSWVSWLLSATS